MALGVGIGALAVGVLVAVLIEVTSIDEADHEDAVAAARSWAAKHRRPGESFKTGTCGEDANARSFRCRVRYEPSGRTYTLYFQALRGREEIGFVRARRGVHPLNRPFEEHPFPCSAITDC